MTQFLESIRLTNFLSYGPAAREIDLLPLNVLIGPNGSGKSNLLEAIDILRWTPTDVVRPMMDGGGPEDFLWRGEIDSVSKPTARIEAIVGPTKRLRYALSFSTVQGRFRLMDEILENSTANPGENDVYFYYRFNGGKPVINVSPSAVSALLGGGKRELQREEVELDQSILQQRRDPSQYPELTNLGINFSKIRLYREFSVGRGSKVRLPQRVDSSGDFLQEDGGNLALVLNNLISRTATHREIRQYLQKFYDSAEELTTRIVQGTVQVFLQERGRLEMPATRLSDGTMRYLCLLAVLLHPEPPPLICIEEPEIGLHADMMPTVAELLVKASEKTQLVVTTHSDVLVSALTEHCESIVVCSQDEVGSHLVRQSSAKLSELLKEQTLGDLWRSGAIGGNRW